MLDINMLPNSTVKIVEIVFERSRPTEFPQSTDFVRRNF